MQPTTKFIVDSRTESCIRSYSYDGPTVCTVAIDMQTGVARIMKKLTFALVLALATCCAGLAFGKEHYREGSVNADTKDAFEKVAASVREGMESGGRYEYVKPAEQQTIEKKLTEMGTIFDQAG